MDLDQTRMIMMMIVKMTMMTHPVLVDHLDQDDQTIAADHPDRRDGPTIVAGHLVQVDQEEAQAQEVAQVLQAVAVAQVRVVVVDQESPR